MTKTLLGLLLAVASGVVSAAPADDVWMSVLLDGRKIGSMHTTRKLVAATRVVTTQEMHIEIERSGLKVGLSTAETDEETPQGKPLRFESRTRISGIESVQSGTIREDGKADIVTSVGGARQTRTIDWPRDALLAEGLRLAELKAGLAPGTRYQTRAFQAENLEAVEVDTTIGKREPVDLPGGQRLLSRVEQTIALGGAPTRTVSWIEPDQTVRKLVVPMMGYELTMLACSAECANGPNQGADILVHALVPAPRAITAAERGAGIRLVLSPTDGGAPLQFASTDEQTVTSAHNETRLSIAPLSEGARGTTGGPTPADSAPNDWLQSDAKEVVALARRGAGEARSPEAQMQSLENFVRGFIRTKDLSVGYASALEVAKNPEGDCTEHAVLLAALGRALGIPTRVVDGLVYVDQYAGSAHVFVPHAWAQAYVSGRWRSYDAALHGFDAGHIALSTGDGDPWRFYAGFNTLGRLRVDAVEAIK
ncbi:MAG: transglutaminase-like domain-containing protein [Rudaea sp.]